MADRHNLVGILSDQQRYDTMACYGNDWIQTPRLNALADESFVFEAPYVTQPVCTPSRVPAHRIASPCRWANHEQDAPRS